MATTTTTEQKQQEDRERASKGIRARQTAIKTIIERHQAEFDELHAKLRLEAGLTARSAGPSREVLEERIRKHEERLAKYRKELELQRA